MTEREEALKEMAQHPIQRDEQFYFKCTQCGKCCQCREDIILSPFDLYDLAKGLNKSMPQVVDDYGIFYVGPTSKVPLVTLRMREEDGKCPFLKDNLCGVHAFKPSVCVLFPLGRAAQGTIDDIHNLEMSYFLQPTNCGTKDEVHTPREWIGAFKITQSEERFMVWQETILSLSTRLQKLLPKIPDHPAETLLSGIGAVLYSKYDLDKPVIPQVKENTKEILDMLDKTEKFVEMMMGKM